MSEPVTFTVEFTMPDATYATNFLRMLDCMRWCSKTGASRVVAFSADGDGNFRPFEFTLNGHELSSDIDWKEHDGQDKLKYTVPKELLPPFKTRRSVDLFFTAE